MEQRDDQTLTYELERVLGQLPQVNLRDVRVSVDRGRARIQGIVSTLAEKQMIMEAAATMGGLVAVDDGIAIETESALPNPDLARDEDEAANLPSGART